VSWAGSAFAVAAVVLVSWAGLDWAGSAFFSCSVKAMDVHAVLHGVLGWQRLCSCSSTALTHMLFCRGSLRQGRAHVRP
jgi:hypothetical protein